MQAENKVKNTQKMQYVEIRLQNRKDHIRKIRAFLVPGDLRKIAEKSGRAYSTVQETLNINETLFSKPVISAAWDLIEESGRLPKGMEKPTPEYIANL